MSTVPPDLPGVSGSGASARRTLGTVGRVSIAAGQSVVDFASVAAAVLWQSCRPLTWRRPVRTEFVRHCAQVAVHGLPSIAVTGLLVGTALVYQLLYWLALVDEVELVGDFVALVLVRELAPVLVGLLVIGRSGAFAIAELSEMRRSGQVRVLDAQGVDPFLYLVVPRVIAASIGVFCLTLVFLVVALAAGLAVGNSLGSVRISTLGFLEEILTAMGPRDYLRLALKSVSIGFVIGVLSVMTGLSASDTRGGNAALLARGFVRAALATLIVSVIFSVLL